MSGENMEQVKNISSGEEEAIPKIEEGLCQPPISKAIDSHDSKYTMSNVAVDTSTAIDIGHARENKSDCLNDAGTSEETGVLVISSIGVAATSESERELSVQISKNQLKKRRRMEKAIEIKQRKKQQKKQVRYERAKAQGRDIDAERIQQEEARIQSATNQNRIKRIEEWQLKMMPMIQKSYQICIDCSYESYMTPKEINSLAIQIRYCYSSNKHSSHPCQLTATSIGCNNSNSTNTNDNSSTNNQKNDQSNCVTLNHLQKVNGFDEWSNFAFHITSDSFDQYFQDKIQQAVYLTSDSENTITTLENDKIYVIGGIVDRNRYKQLTFHRATALGIATAKLPIDEYLSTMPSTRVLTTNHVVDLLIKYREYNGCWKKALADVLPIRKDAKFVEEENKVVNDK